MLKYESVMRVSAERRWQPVGSSDDEITQDTQGTSNRSWNSLDMSKDRQENDSPWQSNSYGNLPAHYMYSPSSQGSYARATLDVYLPRLPDGENPVRLNSGDVSQQCLGRGEGILNLGRGAHTDHMSPQPWPSLLHHSENDAGKFAYADAPSYSGSATAQSPLGNFSQRTPNSYEKEQALRHTHDPAKSEWNIEPGNQVERGITDTCRSNPDNSETSGPTHILSYPQHQNWGSRSIGQGETHDNLVFGHDQARKLQPEEKRAIETRSRKKRSRRVSDPKPPYHFLILVAFQGKKNNQGRYDCFPDCSKARSGHQGSKRRGNLIQHLRDFHGQDIPYRPCLAALVVSQMQGSSTNDSA